MQATRNGFIKIVGSTRSHGLQEFPGSEFLPLAIQDVLALDAVRSPGNRIQTLGADFDVASEADSITAFDCGDVETSAPTGLRARPGVGRVGIASDIGS